MMPPSRHRRYHDWRCHSAAVGRKKPAEAGLLSLGDPRSEVLRGFRVLGSSDQTVNLVVFLTCLAVYSRKAFTKELKWMITDSCKQPVACCDHSFFSRNNYSHVCLSPELNGRASLCAYIF
ncbi:hypothetical protein L1987_59950 [Smallanthus sonchifolius]|uniref:Uncharacterized protein n=1 Tax=Smallanthus sonchifolius TaxID=185202 RepID=A0ACB9D6X7_9ASTR|nr:hypothetical protein L1987_59950 [Smallanthus sonchifolius]